MFLIIVENEGYNRIISNQYAPILNALADDYGLATNYSRVGDPSEPNYVAIRETEFGSNATLALTRAIISRRQSALLALTHEAVLLKPFKNFFGSSQSPLHVRTYVAFANHFFEFGLLH